MNIQVVSFNCILKTKTGTFISATYNREVLTAIEDDKAMLPGLTKAMQSLTKGEKRMVELSAQEAYGFYDPAKVLLFPKKKLPLNLRVGDTVNLAGKSGTIRSYRVLHFHDQMVSLDTNHPLAGQDLIFEIETIDARDATREEIEASSCNGISKQLLH